MLSRLRKAWSPASADTRANQAWLEHTVADLRALGFFAGDDELSDQELAAQIASDHHVETGEVLTESTTAVEVQIACHDPSRVWWQTCPVKPGQEAWIQALRGWAEISRGAFDPCFALEQWQSPRGPVMVTFQHGNRHCELHPRLHHDRIDLAMLRSVNASIAGNEINFAVCAGAKPRAHVVVAVTPGEYLRLTGRGWPLAIP